MSTNTGRCAGGGGARVLGNEGALLPAGARRRAAPADAAADGTADAVDGRRRTTTALRRAGQSTRRPPLASASATRRCIGGCRRSVSRVADDRSDPTCSGYAAATSTRGDGRRNRGRGWLRRGDGPAGTRPGRDRATPRPSATERSDVTETSLTRHHSTELQRRRAGAPVDSSGASDSGDLRQFAPWGCYSSSSSLCWADFLRSSRQCTSWVLGCRHSRSRYSNPGSSTIGIGSGDAGATAPTTILASAGMNGDCAGIGAVTISTGSP